MPQRPLALAVLGASVALVAGPAQANVTLVSDDRSLYADFYDPYFSQVLDDAPLAPFAAWDENVYAGGAYYASQASEAITDTRMAASGVADGFSEQGSANSTFSITFDVTAPTSYRLSGTLSENVVAFNQSQVMLSQGASTIFSAEADFNTMQFFDTGVLSPGQYVLFAEADWNETAEHLPLGSATFELVFQVIPEPGTGLLVGLGCLLLASGRRRARAR